MTSKSAFVRSEEILPYDDDAVSVGDGNVVGVRHNAGDGNGD